MKKARTPTSTPPPALEDLLTIKAAARLAQVSERTINYWLTRPDKRSGKPPLTKIKLASCVRISRTQLASLLQIEPA